MAVILFKSFVMASSFETTSFETGLGPTVALGELLAEGLAEGLADLDGGAPGLSVVGGGSLSVGCSVEEDTAIASPSAPPSAVEGGALDVAAGFGEDLEATEAPSGLVGDELIVVWGRAPGQLSGQPLLPLPEQAVLFSVFCFLLRSLMNDDVC